MREIHNQLSLGIFISPSIFQKMQEQNNRRSAINQYSLGQCQGPGTRDHQELVYFSVKINGSQANF